MSHRSYPLRLSASMREKVERLSKRDQLPVLLVNDRENKQFVVCIDEESDMLGTERGDALFNGDEPSDFTSSALEFLLLLGNKKTQLMNSYQP